MKISSKAAVVLTTASSVKEARRLAHLLLEGRAVACATLVPRVESRYRWKGKIECSSESLLLLKTTVRALGRLKKLLARHHSYEVPELLAVHVDDGLRPYLNWVAEASASRAR